MLHWHAVARLLVKIAGVIMVVNALVGLPAAMYGFIIHLSLLEREGGSLSAGALFLLVAARLGSSIISAVVGVGLFLWRRRVLVGNERDEHAPIEAEGLHALEAILIAVLGIYFFADGLIEIIRAVASELLNVVVHAVPWQALLRANLFVFYGAGIMKVILGTLLILRQEGTIAVYNRLRRWIWQWRRWPYQGEQA
jgi:hypothetical protein